MIVLLFFAFLSGLVTILAPCIWPLLPIVLSATTTGGHRKPLGITVGIITSFAIFTLTISYIVRIIPFDPEVLRYLAVIVIGILGLTLLIPKLGAVLEGWISTLSGAVGSKVRPQNQNGFKGGLLVGLSLGIVWTPCAGPILATIATLGATRSVNWEIVLVTIVYVVGVGIPLFLFATVGRNLLTKSRYLNKYTGVIQHVFGGLMLLTAVAIYTGYDRTIQANLLDAIPSYSQFLNKLEGNEAVKNQLDKLRGNELKQPEVEMNFPKSNRLPKLKKAPELVGISNWLNSKPVTLKSLQGKVILIDFWTYTCINCIRTFPHIKSWWETYRDDGFVLIGVHTPEFEFEKKTENVANALKQYGLTYPVAQDNDYRTWQAFDNHYWPAHYLIDKDGYIRYIHFGEGKYEETEEAIRTLLEETGSVVEKPMVTNKDATPLGQQTPETYLGMARLDRFSGSGGRLIQPGINRFGLYTQNLALHHFTLEGVWNVTDEHVESGDDALLKLNFFANKVFLVITPGKSSDRIRVLLDSEIISEDYGGADVKNGIVTLDEARLYELVDLGGNRGKHLLQLEFLSPGTKVFAFTFE